MPVKARLTKRHCPFPPASTLMHVKACYCVIQVCVCLAEWQRVTRGRVAVAFEASNSRAALCDSSDWTASVTRRQRCFRYDPYVCMCTYRRRELRVRALADGLHLYATYKQDNHKEQGDHMHVRQRMTATPPQDTTQGFHVAPGLIKVFINDGPSS